MTRRTALAAVGALIAAPFARASRRPVTRFAPSIALFRQAGCATLGAAVQAAADQGFTTLDDTLLLVRPEAERRDLAAGLRDRGLTIGTFLANGGYADDGLAAGRAGAVRQLADDVERSVAVARGVGCRVLTILPGGGTDAPDDLRRAADGVRGAAEAAHAAGCCLGIEALDRRRYPGILVGTPEEAAALCALVDHPGCRVLFDAHQAATPEASFRRVASRVAYVQVVATPGRPFARPDALLRAMREHGVAGPVGVDGPGLSAEESRHVLALCRPPSTP